ncbi:hypothetical protein JMJ77_0003790 [Colletotrichum scovillei]|uniref:Uncharacterized protein n=1 Tax=Colletotrichum scovillei TaxID=1209932 RepID=A0A9P7QW83_9PEZI|nr:hypothetical protein JMJ77_0003790 [Colletotrichum scovillei]KAG7049036.1 hypothetical protein JMJ78_0013020 [Colletotrichum scovillei]KAG7063780.1 hypothetical protein JMJ76_0006829 [Colletotrichum scovillei]
MSASFSVLRSGLMLSTKCSNSVLYFRAVESGLCRLLVDMLIVLVIIILIQET